MPKKLISLDELSRFKERTYDDINYNLTNVDTLNDALYGYILGKGIKNYVNISEVFLDGSITIDNLIYNVSNRTRFLFKNIYGKTDNDNKTKITKIIVHGKNLLDLKNRERYQTEDGLRNLNPNTSINFDKNYVFYPYTRSGYGRYSDGTYYSVYEDYVKYDSYNSSYGIGFNIILEQNETYTFKAVNENLRVAVTAYDSTGKYLRDTYASIPGESITFTTQSDEFYWIVSISGVLGENTVYEWQLELGSVPTKYGRFFKQELFNNVQGYEIGTSEYLSITKNEDDVYYTLKSFINNIETIIDDKMTIFDVSSIYEDGGFIKIENINSQYDTNPNIDIEVSYQKYVFQEDDITFTVGSSGNFSTLNEAIKQLSILKPIYRKFESGGLGRFDLKIKILTGTTINEQIFLSQQDLQYITIVAEDEYVNVNCSGFVNSANVHDARGTIPFIAGENAAKLPTIGCVFKFLQGDNDKNYSGLLVNRGSEAIVLSNSGFDGFYAGVIANNESSITIREGICRNCTMWGIHARHNGEISARSCDLSNCGYGAFADRIADIDARNAKFKNCVVALSANNLSRINANSDNDIDDSGCGGDGSSLTWIVEAQNGAIINANGMQLTNATNNIFKVENAGTILRFGVNTTGIISGKSVNNRALNTLSDHGIIFG